MIYCLIRNRALQLVPLAVVHNSVVLQMDVKAAL